MSKLNGQQYAGFWRRFIATVIDSTLFAVVLTIIFGPVFVNSSFWSWQGLIKNALTIFVTVFLWVEFIGTPGKLLMGCQVVDATSGKPLSTKQAMLRYLGYYLSIFSFMIGFLWIAWDKKKQGFHDKIANTVVVYNAFIERDDESQKTLQQLVGEVR